MAYEEKTNYDDDTSLYSFLRLVNILATKWWFILLSLAPAILMYALLPYAVHKTGNTVALAVTALTAGVIMIGNHIAGYIAQHGFSITGSLDEFRILKVMRTVWLVMLGISLFVSVELGLAALYAMTPAGTADGFAVGSLFYDSLIADEGIYLDNCWSALYLAMWQFFSAAVINIDLTLLWMHTYSCKWS